MSAATYNQSQREAGAFTDEMVVELVEFWQRHHHLAVDGYAGPNTQASLLVALSPIDKIWPLVLLPDGRKPQITSGFYTDNPSRPTHRGVDLFYRWLDSDPDVPVGDGGALKRNGKRRWWYPPLGSFPRAGEAIAAAAGKVTLAGKISTGWRCWVDHGNGERTGYFHLERLYVNAGDEVQVGDPLGVVGDSPRGHDGKHLHFEVSPTEAYRPRNPRLWLRGARLFQVGDDGARAAV